MDLLHYGSKMFLKESKPNPLYLAQVWTYFMMVLKCSLKKVNPNFYTLPNKDLLHYGSKMFLKESKPNPLYLALVWTYFMMVLKCS